MSTYDLLVESMDDSVLSTVEKHQLRAVLSECQRSDQLSAVRNQAFDIVRKQGVSLPHLKWLEQVVKTIDQARPNAPDSPVVSFSPGRECRTLIVDTLNRARKTLDVCVFTISDNKIYDAICSAYKRGVLVRVITDNDKSEDLGSDVESLEAMGVSVRMDNTEAHMHHKFAIVDQRWLLNGSYNWTRSAETRNEENVVKHSDASIIEPFQTQFEKLWKKYK